MRIQSSLVLGALAVGVSLPGTVGAQIAAPSNPPYAFYVAVFGTPQAGDMRLHVEFHGYGEEATLVWPETPAGIDLYRRAVGFVCGDFERLNPEPLPFAWDAGNIWNPMNLHFVDETTSHLATPTST
jgi:hypothetical protein